MRIETMKEMDGTGEGQPVPKTASEAAAFFRCAVLASSMMGARCATNYGDACAGSAARVSCRGCSAGRAREALLRGVSASERVVSPALALPMPPRRRCEECGMDMGSSRHTPTTCRRTADALRAAASSGAAMARAAEREALAKRRSEDRERARAEQRAKSAAARAERAEARKVDRAAKAAERAARAEHCAQPRPRTPESAARAMRKAARAALLASGMLPADADRRRAAHANRVDASERAGMVCPRIGCGNPAGLSKIGTWCQRCINIARMTLRRRTGARVAPDQIAQWLNDRPQFSKPPIEWDTVTDLGVVSDGVIAARMGVSKAAVRHARLARGIEPYKAGQIRQVHDPASGVPPQRPDDVRDANGRIVWTNVDWSMGSDGTIAKAINSNITTVRAARERLGLPCARDRGLLSPRIDWSVVPFGTMSDRQIARILGTNRATVRDHRRAAGVAPFPGRGRARRAAPAAEPVES